MREIGRVAAAAEDRSAPSLLQKARQHEDRQNDGDQGCHRHRYAAPVIALAKRTFWPILRERLALDCVGLASPSTTPVTIASHVPPVRPYAPPRVIQADLASADGAGKASLDLILLAGFVPGLQLEIPRIGPCAAEGEGDAVVKLAVDEQRLGQFQLSNELDLNARPVASGRPNSYFVQPGTQIVCWMVCCARWGAKPSLERPRSGRRSTLVRSRKSCLPYAHHFSTKSRFVSTDWDFSRNL